MLCDSTDILRANMKKKQKSTQMTPHVQEQCGVWLSAKGRSKLKEGSNNQRTLPCTSTPRQSRVVLGELIIPQPRPRIGGKQSKLSMFFKPVPVSPLSSTSTLKSSGKEGSYTPTKTSSKLNLGGGPTEPPVESTCNIPPENLAVGDSEGSFSILKETDISDRGVKSEKCQENAANGFTGCTLDENSSGTANIGHSPKEDNSEASTIGKCSYVFQKVDLTYGHGSRKRSHSLVESAGKSFLVQDVTSKRCRTESYSSQEDVLETCNFGSDRIDDQSETKEKCLADKGNTDETFKVSCLNSECESVNSETRVNIIKPAKFFKINRTLTSQAGLFKSTNGVKGHDKNSLISQNCICSEIMEDSLQSISEEFVDRNKAFASKSHLVKDLTDDHGDVKNDSKSQNYAPLEVDNSLQSSAPSEDSFNVDDSLTPAILRNSIYRDLDLTSDLPLTNPQLSNFEETASCNSDDSPYTLAFDPLQNWSESENDSTEITRKF